MSWLARFYSDYLWSGRWTEYRAVLAAAKTAGYRFVLHQDARAALAGRAGDRLFFLRHDIDTDLPLARTMFLIERELDVRSTYYFRRCTADVAFMREVAAFGCEVGYHYEEIADHAKARHLRSREAVVAEMELIRDAFLANLQAFEAALGVKVRTAASHGDFANRRLGLHNHALMDDRVRGVGGIELEAYDHVLNAEVGFRTSDVPYPELWVPASPLEGIKRRIPVVLALVHPRYWARAPLARMREDLGRLVEGARYTLG
jgi:hypothetical protein